MATRFCLTLAVLLGANLAAAATAPDTLVLCPPALQPALARWVAYRTDQGHRVQVVEPESTPAGIQRQVRQAAAAEKLQFVVLVGDAAGQDAAAAADRDGVSLVQSSRERPPPRWGVPTALVPARINTRWGSEEEIATDGPYADLDDDGLPDVAIGRLPVRSVQELRTVLDKVIHYEQAADHSMWRRQLKVVAGLGGFGRVADAALEVTTRTLLTSGIPAGYHTHLTYASWQSPYCPPPPYFRESLIDGWNDGCLFWVYLGHGTRTVLDHVYVPGGSFPIMARSDATRLGSAAGSSIALLVACHSGAFDSAEECLAEAILTAPGGPVAVVAGSRVTLPYGNAVLCSELMNQCFTHRRPTVGELLLYAKRSCTSDRSGSSSRNALDFLATLLSPLPNELAAERHEHTLLYNLLGDPLLRIAHAGEVALQVPQSVRAGRTLTVRGTSSVAGHCTVELVSERGRLPFSPPPREHYDQSDAAVAEYDHTYRRANDRRHVATSVPVRAGTFTAELQVPDTARGTCYLRVFVAGQTGHALGAAKMVVLSHE